MYPAGRVSGPGRKDRTANELCPLEPEDEALIAAARDVITRNYREERHTVGAAVRAASGQIYTGVNLETVGYGPCAEPVAVGAAISQGERAFTCIVAVNGWGDRQKPIPPCGNCRQFLMEYAPDAWVILEHGGQLVKVRVRELLPDPYLLFRP